MEDLSHPTKMEIVTNPDVIIEELKAGNQRFLEGKTNLSPACSLERLKDFAAKGQLPKCIILCCSDSRGPVEMIFDQDLGELFVIRVAGNIVAPSLVGSVEFAADSYGTSLVVVMGHTKCGAVAATLDSIEQTQPAPTDNLHDIVSRIKPHIYQLAVIQDMPRAEKMDKAVEANVHASVAQLSHSSRLIEGLVQSGKIKIVGAVLQLDTGEVKFLDEN